MSDPESRIDLHPSAAGESTRTREPMAEPLVQESTSSEFTPVLPGQFSGSIGAGTPWPRRVAFGAATVFAITLGSLSGGFFTLSDAGHYLRMAQGADDVMQPFASRQLGPLLVRGVAGLTHLSIQHAFVLQGVLALLVLAAFVFLGAAPRNTPPALLAAMVCVPFWPEIFHGLALPDLGYAALLSVFLWLLQREQWLAAAGMMLPLMIARESTSLTLVCFLIAGWRELRWAGRGLAVVAALVGARVVSRLTAHSLGNTEHLPGFLYMLLKVPWNTSRLFGILPWSNQYQAFCTVPHWQISLHVASVSAVGLCGVNPLDPLLALGALTTTFGLLPLLALWLWRRRREANSKDPLLRFSLLYGCVSFVLAPLIGVSYSRLFGYAWPLLLVAVPLLAAEPLTLPSLLRKAHWKLLLVLHAAACAAALLSVTFAAAAGVLLWIAGAVLLFRLRSGSHLSPAGLPSMSLA